MMPAKARRPIAIIFILVGFIGLVLGGVGIYQIWQARAGVETSLLAALDTTHETITITQSALTTASGALDTIGSNLTQLNNTLQTVAQSLNDAVPVLSSFATLMQDKLPTTLEATQTSLETAEASAALLDSIMRALTSIPFYLGEPYQPEVPLDVSVQNVAASLDDLPASLIEIGGQLETNQSNFSDIEDELIALSVTLTGINTDLTNAQATLTAYETLLTDLDAQLTLLETSLPDILSVVAWFLTVLLGWLMFTQLGLIVQGLTLAEVQLFHSAQETLNS